ncbi:PAQR family membrane homeostasis protein TrhA [Massiliimalia massiliensis]|uniref:PAQR family membrane homeostasis protein TrhA n=1 Tax=Massiliimalia massiliensis TaxID=1852384 RepID=UPI0009842FBF|nr:hemolysin III family protein [Massiliimalia massiliensis]
MPQPNKKRFLPFYTVGEEIANSVTHGLGSLLSIAGCAVIIVFAALTGDPFKIVSAAIFSAGLIIMFTMSTLYHSLTNEKAKFVFRVFDHTSIFILIAATYTPLTLVSLRGWIGWTIFGVVWGSAIVGIILNAVSVERFKVLSMVCYIASGWCVIAAIVPLTQRMESMGVALLVLGGIAYTGGLFFYRKKEIRYMHSVWHLFVLAGAVFHYFCILFYVV